MPTFRERLRPPLRWWALGALAVVVVFAIMWSALSTLVAGAATLLLAVVLAAALVGYAAEVVVDDYGLRAGAARLPWSAIGAVTALDRDGAAHLRGPGADPRSYLVLRAYVPTAVRVDVDDPADPTPYWYVSTRRPTELVATLRAGGRAPAV